jgi:hypothetical protein
MNWLYRPSILVFVSVALALSAVAVVLWQPATEHKALPQPVKEGEQEIVWLYAATNNAPWERFVTAVDKAVGRLQAERSDLGLEITARNPFPPQTTAVPELALTMKGAGGKLWLRWYKLTSDLKSRDWVRALLQRQPPPLAIIGGGSSDLALELAHSLREEVEQRGLGATAPLLLLTTATVEEEGNNVPLTRIYAGRTFRFCFTNRQMAEAVTQFIWSRDQLRPDSEPFYLTYWKDDPYSKDLNDRFVDALAVPATAQAAARDWAWLAHFSTVGGLPLDLGGMWQGRSRRATPVSEHIISSVGGYARPNQWEAQSARDMMKVKTTEYPKQQRPLLVVPAAVQPARRFLRALTRTAPLEAQRFVVATGDGISFNTVYRDRNLAWPIQDLPCSLVFFCHRNPVDREAGFRPAQDARPVDPDEVGISAAGTEDLLLFVDIVEALVQAVSHGGRFAAHADELGQHLRQARWLKEGGRVRFGPDGPYLFDDEGNRRSGTGEHVVWLRTAFAGNLWLPAANLEVWSWQAESPSGIRHWQLQASPLHLTYENYQEPE